MIAIVSGDEDELVDEQTENEYTEDSDDDDESSLRYRHFWK